MRARRSRRRRVRIIRRVSLIFIFPVPGELIIGSQPFEQTANARPVSVHRHAEAFSAKTLIDDFRRRQNIRHVVGVLAPPLELVFKLLEAGFKISQVIIKIGFLVARAGISAEFIVERVSEIINFRIQTPHNVAHSALVADALRVCFGGKTENRQTDYQINRKYAFNLFILLSLSAISL